MPRSILIADDDPHILDVVGYALERAGYAISVVSDGAAALNRFTATRPDLVILDVSMPEMDGLEVCRRIRLTDETPILFLSSRDEEIDRILGLELGGDDYVSKPFSPRELVARVKAILKRSGPAPEPAGEDLTVGALHLSPQRHEARFAETTLSLTATEFRILEGFMRRPGLVVDRATIIEFAYGGDIHVSDRTIASHVRNIRLKLDRIGCEEAIETVHGVGHRLGACEARSE